MSETAPRSNLGDFPAAASEFDPADPYRREAQTFPQLSDDQIARVETFGAVEDLPAGTILFSRGERSVDFFVIVRGSVEITDPSAGEEPAVIHVHRDGQFTGELDLFNNREILVGGRTGAETRLIRVPRAAFRRMIDAEPDIGETVMRAFILRRVGLMRYAQGGVTLVGPPLDGDLLRIRRFLARNGYPHRLVDGGQRGGGGAC